MVIITINHIDPIYQNINNWNRLGITNVAVRLCARQWQKEDYFGRYSTIWEIRNEQWDKGKVESCKELNKW